MPRRKVVAKRQIDPDPRFNSVLVSKFINNLMERGKKSVARSIFYDAMDLVADRVSEDSPLEVFEKAMEQVRPRVEVKSRRVGGATYQVPIEVRPERRRSDARQPRLETAPPGVSPPARACDGARRSRGRSARAKPTRRGLLHRECRSSSRS